jgi:hypothetical protein
MIAQAAAAVLLMMASQAAADASRRIGLAAGEFGECLAMPGGTVPDGTPVLLITPDVPQRTSHAVIVGPLAECPAMARRDIAGPYYRLAPESPSASPPALSVAILGKPESRSVNGEIHVRLDAHPDARVRACASSEGLHLTVWSGAPLISARLWHAYWYLGFDVEADCRPDDYR